jgi:hypothetical protein
MANRQSSTRANAFTLGSLLCALAAGLVSCSESTSPPIDRHPPRLPSKPPSRDFKALPVASVTLPAIGVSSMPIVDYTAFPEGVVVDISIEGNILFESHERAFPIHYSGPLDYLGIRVENGTGCLVKAQVVFSQISGAGNPFPNSTACLLPRTMNNYMVRAKVGGQGTALRGPMPDQSHYPCDSVVAADGWCYRASGSQTVTVWPVAADLDFAGTYGGVRSHSIFVPRFVVDSSNVTIPGNGFQSVKFSDSTFARGMPLKNLNHTWNFADPTDPGDSYWHKTENTCYAGLLYCEVNIKETGNMLSLTRVNGVEHTDTVTVYCSDSMAVFNSDKVRQGLMAALDSSGGGLDSGALNSRKERGFFILQDTTTPGSKPFIWLLPQKPNASWCGIGGSLPEFDYRPAGTKIVGWGHTHPAIGFVGICPDSLGVAPQDSSGMYILARAVPGISEEDQKEIFRRNDSSYVHFVGPVNHYVMQSDGTLLMLKPGQLRGAALRLAANHFKWKKGRCAWPRRKL